MKKNLNVYLLLLSFTLLFLYSCSSSTRITSEPPGASVYMNGSYIGETPMTYEDSKISLSKSHLVLEKEGFDDFYTVLRKDEEVDPAAIIGGIFFGFPFIWTMGYAPEHHYVLAPTTDTAGIISDDEKESISKLNEMYKKGIITQEEFEILKGRIIKE